jgi:hypothetical protein
VRSALRRGGWQSGRPTSAVPSDRRCMSDLPRFGSTLGRARQITRILTPRRQQQRCYTLGISARWLPSLSSLECLVGAVCFDKALNRLQVVRKGCGLPLRLSAVAVVKVDPYLKRHARTIGEAMSAPLLRWLPLAGQRTLLKGENARVVEPVLSPSYGHISAPLVPRLGLPKDLRWSASGRCGPAGCCST